MTSEFVSCGTFYETELVCAIGTTERAQREERERRLKDRERKSARKKRCGWESGEGEQLTRS